MAPTLLLAHVLSSCVPTCPAPDEGSVPVSGTFSIVAVDPEGAVCGAAVASKYPAVGSVVPYVRAGVGAFCTQHWHEPAWGPRALDALAAGKGPQEVLADLLRDDPRRDKRQLAAIDMTGRTAQNNPTDADPSGIWWGSCAGRFYACQGNTLTGRDVVAAMAKAYEETTGSLADRLVAALVAGDAVGGDHRGRLAAGIRVAKVGVSGHWLELNVDRSDDAVRELKRAYDALDHEAKGAPQGEKEPPGTATSPFEFDGAMPRKVLERYLARSITMMDLLTHAGEADDAIRMLTSMGAKFAGRAVYLWGGERSLPGKLETAKAIAARIHEADPEMILQGGIFEIVTRAVDGLTIPAWVFEAFDQPAEARNFSYDAMLFPDGRFRDHWSSNASVPDIRQVETKRWFFYLAASYIGIGCEALHIGQIELIGKGDPTNAHWWDVLSRMRRYAASHARRHLVLIDGHVPSGGLRYEGDKLLCDFHSFPLRPEEVAARPQQAILIGGHLDSIYGRSAGGIAPSGWRCDHLPYLVELDNFDTSGREGQDTHDHFVWGYDEISWFARQPEAYRNSWLRSAWTWVREHDPAGYLQMPGSRCLAAPAEGKSWYFANKPSAACPRGFNQEDTIKAIWAEDQRER